MFDRMKNLLDLLYKPLSNAYRQHHDFDEEVGLPDSYELLEGYRACLRGEPEENVIRVNIRNSDIVRTIESLGTKEYPDSSK